MLQRVPVKQLGGQPILLGELADIRLEESPPGIEHEAGRRRTFISANVRDRDVASFVQEAQRRVREQVELPAGYSVEWGGDFENLRSASLRLGPHYAAGAAVDLDAPVHEFQVDAIGRADLPRRPDGSLRWHPCLGLSRHAVQYFRRRRIHCPVWRCRPEWSCVGERGRELACQRNVSLAKPRFKRRWHDFVPILMTALVASLGFLPMAISTTAGAEIQRPLATVVIGGLITSTLLTAVVVPAIYPWFAPEQPADEV